MAGNVDGERAAKPTETFFKKWMAKSSFKGKSGRAAIFARWPALSPDAPRIGKKTKPRTTDTASTPRKICVRGAKSSWYIASEQSSSSLFRPMIERWAKWLNKKAAEAQKGK